MMKVWKGWLGGAEEWGWEGRGGEKVLGRAGCRGGCCRGVGGRVGGMLRG
jgi:hypothetical protein